jgi:hypothetical protein
MGVNDILKETANLKPAEKYIIIENLIQELNQIDTSIEKAWIEESEKRLKLYENGKLETLSYEEVFNQ